MSDIAIAFFAGVGTAWASIAFGIRIATAVRSGRPIAPVPWKTPKADDAPARPVRSNLGNL